MEEILLDFKGTVLLVSHDREFMDNVVTSTLVLEGNGVINDYVGGYSDWVAHGGKLVSLDDEGKKSAPEKPAAKKPASTVVKKLSYKDQRELDALPERIEQLETQQGELEATVSAPEFYQQEHDATEAVLKQLADVQKELAAAYARWEELAD